MCIGLGNACLYELFSSDKTKTDFDMGCLSGESFSNIQLAMGILAKYIPLD